MDEAPRAKGGRARWLNGQTLAVLCFIATTVTAVASVGAMTQAGLNALRTDLGDQIKELRAEVRADIAGLRAEVRGDMGKLDARVRSVEIQLTAIDVRMQSVEIQLTAVDVRMQSVEVQLAAEGRIATAQTPLPAGGEAGTGSIALPD